MGDSNTGSDDEWVYPPPRFEYWWVVWALFILIIFYIMYGFILAGEGTWFEVILFLLIMVLYPSQGCYKVKKYPNKEVPPERASTEIETERALNKEDLE